MIMVARTVMTFKQVLIQVHQTPISTVSTMTAMDSSTKMHKPLTKMAMDSL